MLPRRHNGRSIGHENTSTVDIGDAGNASASPTPQSSRPVQSSQNGHSGGGITPSRPDAARQMPQQPASNSASIGNDAHGTHHAPAPRPLHPESARPVSPDAPRPASHGIPTPPPMPSRTSADAPDAPRPQRRYAPSPAASPQGNAQAQPISGQNDTPPSVASQANHAPPLDAAQRFGRTMHGGASAVADKMPNFVKNGAAKGLNRLGHGIHRARTSMRRTAMRAKNLAMGAWNFITSPVGWISIVMVVSLLFVETMYGTYGNGGIDCSQNTVVANALDGSADSGSSSGGIWNASAQTMAKAFQAAGYSEIATAGAMGNIQQESGFSPTVVNSIGATGMAQWMGGRLAALKNYATSKGLNYLTAEAQSGYLVNVELSGSHSGFIPASGYDAWAKASDINTAADEWNRGFERSGTGSDVRARFANALKSHLDSISGWAAPGSEPASSTAATTADSSSSASTDEAQCLLTSDTAANSSTGSFPQGRGSYAWMCSGAKVCKDGDYGPLGAISGTSEGYQCVWYAWTRLWMLHGHNASTLAPMSGNGGAIWETLQGKAGWTVSTTPQAGDGISGVFGGADPTYGHVAVVEKVENTANGWTITISEGNFDNRGDWNGYHGGRTFTKAQIAATNAHFFRNNAWK